MEKHIGILHKSKLFISVCEDEIKRILPCLQAREIYYKEGERITPPDSEAGVIVCGSAYIKASDNSALRTLSQGEMIVNSALPQCAYISAATDCTVIFFNTYKLLTVCSKSCPFHQTVIKNLFKSVSDETALFTERLIHLTKRNIKEKLLSYLTCESVKNNSSVFEVNLTRTQLAEYLCVDRAAMTTELFKLQKEGIIKIDRKRIEILE